MQSLDGGIEHQSSQSHTILNMQPQYSVEGGGEGVAYYLEVQELLQQDT